MKLALQSGSVSSRTNGAAAVKTGVAPGQRRPGAKVREASFADHAGISALQLRNGLEPAPDDEWEGLWTRNPAYLEVKDRWPIGWVVESEAGEIVGYIGNIPLAYHFRGRPIRATSPCGWAVDPPYRRDALRMLGRVASQPGIDLIMCTTVGPAAEPIWRLLEVRTPVGTWDRSQFWIVGYRGFAQSLLRSRSVPMPAALSYPAALALFCSDVVRGTGLFLRGAAAHTPEIEIRNEFDARFDDFWRELRRQKSEVLMADRSRATLEWHFRSTLKAGTVWICTVNDGPRLAAYAIFERRDRAEFGLRRLRITDFQALAGFEWTISSILQRMLAWSRERRFHMLENSGCWLARLDLPPIHAPRQRRLPSWAYYYKSLDPELSEALKSASAWAPSAYDGDTSL